VRAEDHKALVRQVIAAHGRQDVEVAVAFVPFNTARIPLFGSTYLNSIAIQAAQADDMTQMTADVTDLMRAPQNRARYA
jgi:hypothetical protein